MHTEDQREPVSPRRRLMLAGAAAALAPAGLLVPTSPLAATGLPDYQPERQVSGVLRTWGNSHMADLMKRWQAGFARFHPEIRFADTLRGTASAQWGLQGFAADLALMSREIWPYEFYGTLRRSYNYPVGVEVATGSFDVPGKSDAFAILVHKDNPITQLTVPQLDAIFGAQRSGGWQGLDWAVQGVARTKETNIRTWGQLGLTGEWADKVIVPYAPPSLTAGSVSTFQTRVMGGADTVNEKTQEFEDRQAMVEAMGRDRYGIGYVGIARRTPQLKALAIAEKAGSPYVSLTRSSVADRSYPLVRPAYAYFTIDTKTGDLADPLVDPKVKEFLHYVLSRQGQEAVASDGGYLPLTPEVAARQRARVDDPPSGRVYRKDRR